MVGTKNFIEFSPWDSGYGALGRPISLKRQSSAVRVQSLQYASIYCKLTRLKYSLKFWLLRNNGRKIKVTQDKKYFLRSLENCQKYEIKCILSISSLIKWSLNSWVNQFNFISLGSQVTVLNFPLIWVRIPLQSIVLIL